MRKVIDARANDDFTMDLRFDDGRVKRFDIKPYLDYQVFQPLRDRDYFKNFRLEFGTVQWADEQDISPDTLYLEGVDVAGTVIA